MKRTRNVVIIGGGTGIYPVVNALRRLPTECASIINASDSGGSTGRIRDEFGFPPVGDLRQSLAAMADPTSQHWIRQLLLYRFEKGAGLKGHNLGNLLLTALQDMTGSTTEALAIAAQVLRIHGTVIPVTETNVQLEIEYEDGTTLRGEHHLDEKGSPHQKVAKMRLSPAATLNPAAATAIHTADFVIIGPGDYYASLQAVLLADGIKAAFSRSQARLVYFVNLMTRPTQTKDMTAAQHVAGIEASLGKALDTILVNTQPVLPSLLRQYAIEDEIPVIDDLGEDRRVVRVPLIAPRPTQSHPIPNHLGQPNRNAITRSLLRHDEELVFQCLKPVIDQTWTEH